MCFQGSFKGRYSYKSLQVEQFGSTIPHALFKSYHMILIKSIDFCIAGQENNYLVYTLRADNYP